ncbi:efflux RND transporter permease subunit [Myroides odoratimimus]|uniref:efflux RND transporter permease subunit n=1 Tax=Myroides odoratimimus TaxID=76832 RepID=UPI00257576F6|nr:CusA/CzcA family heavy metal efflux RND transporter [Myroides odoratimimus]MDM1096910.1 efflux RND transporter permease subunit [Myroides odoratimimus]MDM1326215.1 efflux RND transporter permease subunit [Myroides odoratimimus]MDM1443008.1 efflux RND transporter permease subunit [Myroides odoratimimus]MDM1448474.1 efflux RND transporter permease subunit [Myroides odoratimimus]MDM1453546.1 efflux RND transporter permease subunit [Myroides odoratimimus]
MQKFVKNIVSFSLKNTFIVIFGVLLLLFGGIYSYIHTPIEAFPDVTNTRARIITQWPGRSAEEVEKFITLPISKEVNTIPNKAEVRSISLFGLSVVTVLFNDDVDDFFAQQYASNRMGNVNLPEGADFEIEPPSGATGEIFRYIIKSDLPIKEVTAIQDWVIERELLSVPGVADVVSFGGEEKIFEIQINPTELINYDLSPLDVYEAVEKSNINVGGDVIQRGDQAYVVRGVGLLDNVEDIENILIEIKGSTPILVKHVANVVVSAKPRLGQVAFQDDEDVVQGIVVMLRGENPSAVIEGLKDKITDLNERVLPKNVQIETVVDRTHLVNTTVHTVSKNLVEGVILVSIIVFIFLYNWRTTFIVASVIPLAFLFAIIMLKIQGLPANLISMGALDFGLLLEGTLVIVEHVFVGLEKRAEQVGMARFNRMSKLGTIKKSASSVASYIFFALLILIVALMPIFSFQKVEGKMFSPLAFTLGYALLGSLILSLTYVPAMCKLLLTKDIKERENVISRFFKNNIYKMFNWSFTHKKLTLSMFIGLLLICGIRFHNYGSEFLPKLNEGALYIRATLPSSINLDESVRLAKEMKAKIRAFDEVKFVLTQTGRPNDGTDPTGFFNIEFHTELKPDNEWTRKISKDQLLEEIRVELEKYPGVNFGFSQPIQDNVEEYVAGVKSSLVIKIFGDDLFELEKYANQVAKSIKDVDGITDLNVFKNIGQPELRIKLHDHKMAKYAVTTADAQAVIAMTIGGQAATTLYENERMFDVVLRFNKEYRDSDDKIGDILIPSLDGKQVPLKEIATIDYHTGPAFIYREGGSRYIGIGFSIEGRDLGSTIAEARAKVNKEVKLPAANKMEWAGEFESKERAANQLMLVVPVSLILILVLLYFNFGNVKDTAIAALTIPFAFIGGFLSLWATGTIFGISAGIGFIILFGVATIDGIVLIGVMRENLQHRMPLKEAIKEGVKSRIRPVVMIALMGSMGLLPAALSNGMGSEIQKPLAIMIVGGLIICMILSFTILPQVFYWAYRNKK